MLDEFKKFILKGNMVDLAVGVIIGGAFGKVVEKFTEFVMSLIGKCLTLSGLPESATNFDSFAPGGIKVGAVITQVVNLCLVGLALFLFIKAYNRFIIKPRPPTPADPTKTEKLLAEIRDSLRKQEHVATVGHPAPEKTAVPFATRSGDPHRPPDAIDPPASGI